MTIYDTREGSQLVLNQQKKGHWNRWGPFLSERAWGTVREIPVSSDRNLPSDGASSKPFCRDVCH